MSITPDPVLRLGESMRVDFAHSLSRVSKGGLSVVLAQPPRARADGYVPRHAAAAVASRYRPQFITTEEN